MKKSNKMMIIAIVLFLISMFIFIVLVHQDYTGLLNEQQNEKRYEFNIISNQFKSNINNTMSFIYGLRGYVYSQENNAITQDSFNAFAENTLHHTNYIKNFSIAPNNVQKYVFPYEGNELAIGHNLATDERIDVRNDIKRAMLSSDIILSGPYELRQGGLGLVVRSPIYYNNTYWGLVNVVVDLESIINNSDISKSNDISFEIYNEEDIFWGQTSEDELLEYTDMMIAEDTWTIKGGFSTTLSKRNMSFLMRNSIITFLFIAMVYFYIIKSLTQNFLLSNKIQNLIYSDILTKLPNRRALEIYLDDYIRDKKPFGLAFIDLDNFKDINDSLGHSFGDKLLIDIANRLNQNDSYKAFRWGGDEFIITSVVDIDDFIIELENIQDLISKPILLDKESYIITGSIGVCYYPNDGLSKEEIIKLADASMYNVKKQGKNKVQIYDESFGKSIKTDFKIERNLENAISNHKLELFYQPKYTIKTNRIESLEALLRWKDDHGQYISPEIFIPIAERSNLIYQIDDYVLEETFKQLSTWQKQDYHPIVSINISANHFTKKFSKKIIEGLKAHNLSPRSLEIEMTETAAIENYETTKLFLNTMNSIGVRTVLDDFGTGYSSMSYLTTLKFDVLKIDRSFISHIDTSKHNQTIVKSIVEIAKILGLEIVAEGIETETEFQIIKNLGCHQYQGFLLSKALPRHEIIKFVEEINAIKRF